MQGKPVVISAVGMPSPVGLTAAQTFASVRARVSRKNEMPSLYLCGGEDPDFDAGTPLVASAFQYLQDERKRMTTPVEWLAYIAARAFHDLASEKTLPPEEDRGVGLFISLPEARPGWGPDREEEFVYHFHNFIKRDIFPFERFDYSGRTGGLSMIGAASAALDRGEIRCAVVGGVDSYLFPEWLEPLDRAYRIRSDRNTDGFVPGECAAFLLLEPEGQPEARSIVPRSRVIGHSRRDCSPSDLRNATGAALGEAIAELIPPGAAPPVVVCDLNGETSRMKEWGFAMARLGTRLGRPVLLEHPADALGEIGAASGAALCVLAVFYLEKKYRHRSEALVFCASDSGERAALLIGRRG